MSDDTASTPPLALTVGRDGDDDHNRRVAAVTCYTLNVTRLVVQDGDTFEGGGEFYCVFFFCFSSFLLNTNIYRLLLDGEFFFLKVATQDRIRFKLTW